MHIPSPVLVPCPSYRPCGHQALRAPKTGSGSITPSVLAMPRPECPPPCPLATSFPGDRPLLSADQRPHHQTNRCKGQELKMQKSDTRDPSQTGSRAMNRVSLASEGPNGRAREVSGVPRNTSARKSYVTLGSTKGKRQSRQRAWLGKALQHVQAGFWPVPPQAPQPAAYLHGSQCLRMPGPAFKTFRVARGLPCTCASRSQVDVPRKPDQLSSRPTHS